MSDEQRKPLVVMQHESHEDSKAWFPETADDLGHTVLALIGEVGELANIIKKVERGSLELNKQTHLDLAMEVTDAFVYILKAAQILNIDLEKAYEHKREVNERRFGSNKRIIPIRGNGDTGETSGPE